MDDRLQVYFSVTEGHSTLLTPFAKCLDVPGTVTGVVEQFNMLVRPRIEEGGFDHCSDGLYKELIDLYNVSIGAFGVFGITVARKFGIHFPQNASFTATCLDECTILYMGDNEYTLPRLVDSLLFTPGIEYMMYCNFPDSLYKVGICGAGGEIKLSLKRLTDNPRIVFESIFPEAEEKNVVTEMFGTVGRDEANVGVRRFFAGSNEFPTFLT